MTGISYISKSYLGEVGNKREEKEREKGKRELPPVAISLDEHSPMQQGVLLILFLQ